MIGLTLFAQLIFALIMLLCLIPLLILAVVFGVREQQKFKSVYNRKVQHNRNQTMHTLDEFNRYLDAKK